MEQCLFDASVQHANNESSSNSAAVAHAFSKGAEWQSYHSPIAWKDPAKELPPIDRESGGSQDVLIYTDIPDNNFGMLISQGWYNDIVKDWRFVGDYNKAAKVLGWCEINKPKFD